MVRVRAIVLGLGALVPLAACGSRGPLDLEIVEATEPDGSSLVDAAAAAAADAADGAATATDGAAAVDAHHDATIFDCGQCLSQQCGTVLLQCLQAAACRTTLQCVATKCLAGGTPDPSCLTACASDPKAIGTVLAVVTCVASKCGTDCAAVLGAAGGIGGGGGGGGRRDGGR